MEAVSFFAKKDKVDSRKMLLKKQELITLRSIQFELRSRVSYSAALNSKKLKNEPP